uniref:Uncharacterized protein n=1 Tax=Panagrolaimus sp. ES5 TaxID=591445 RepID=A0AC34G9Y0_9BILA
MNTPRIDHNKAREMGRYDWNLIKDKLFLHLNENRVYKNAKFNVQMAEQMLNAQDFIVVQNPTKTHLDLVGRCCSKAVILLIGNYKNPAPVLSDRSPTSEINLLMESPMLIDQVVTSLPDPVVKASLYLPGAPAEDVVEKMKYLSSVAKQHRCSLASTMAVENIPEFASLSASKTKAAFCFVSEKVARIFLSNCALFNDVTVVGEAQLRAIVQSVCNPPSRKRKAQDEETAEEEN